MGKPVYKSVVQTNGQPCAVSFYFADPIPKLTVWARDAKTNRLYYVRYCHTPVKEIHINFPKAPLTLLIGFETDNPFMVKTQLLGNIEKPVVDWSDPKLTPEVKRNWPLSKLRIQWVDLGYPKGTPGRIFVSGPDAGLMQLDPRARDSMPAQWWRFIPTHEVGHYFHDSEEGADLWALHKYMEDGYNISQAELALVYILKYSQEKAQRLTAIFKETREFEAKYFNR